MYKASMFVDGRAREYLQEERTKEGGLLQHVPFVYVVKPASASARSRRSLTPSTTAQRSR